jgi:hypothetical protein
MPSSTSLSLFISLDERKGGKAFANRALFSSGADRVPRAWRELRKRFIPLWELGTRGGLPGIRSRFGDCGLENGSLRCLRALGAEDLHNLILSRFVAGEIIVIRPALKTVSRGEGAFRDQFRLGRQPMRHLLPGQRNLVSIIEVHPAGHFVR